MNPNRFQRQSLKAKVTFFTLAIFVIGIWSLALYVSQMLREDMQRMLGEQQFSTASIVAAQVNDELVGRLTGLKMVAGIITPAMIRNPATLQTMLDGQGILLSLFNNGVAVAGPDGTVISDAPVLAGRIGTNFMDRDYAIGALREGKAIIGRPAISKVTQTSTFVIAVPVHDNQGRVIAVLAGVTDLGKSNFLDKITQGRYGKAGGYLILVAPQHRLVVTSSDKRLIMQSLFAPGTNPLVDRFVQGYEGSGLLVNALGDETLSSAKGVPVAGWYAAVSLPTAEAFAPIRDMQRRMLFATAFLILLAGGLTWWMLRRQLSPMLAAAKALGALSDPNQSPQPLPIASQDEIGELISGFNRLLETLKQREAALAEGEARFRSLTSLSSDWYWEQDRELRLTSISSSAFAKNLAQDAESSLGKRRWEHPNRFPLSGTWDEHRALLEAHKTFQDFEFVRIDADGGKIIFSLSGEPIIDADGSFRGYRGVGKNVTERKQAEHALARESRQNQAFLRNASDGVHIIDSDGTVLEVSDSFSKMLGYSREELIGANVSLWDAQWSPQELKQRIAEQMSRQDRSVFETRHRRRDGSIFDVEVSGQPLELDGRRVLFNSSRDITDRKRRQRELIATRQAAEDANLAKSRFLASASHDLRQPIQAIGLFAMALANSKLSDEQRQMCDYLLLSAKNLGDLLNALLDISSLDSGSVKPAFEVVKAEALFGNIDAEFCPLAVQKRLRFNVHCALGEFGLYTDPKLSRSLIGNLLGNAIKYTERGGIQVGIRRRGRQALVQVWDTGVGIAPEHIDRIFEEYFQIGNPERDKANGLGLGLAIAKRLAKLLDTELVCRSRVGKGSVFEFQLPLADKMLGQAPGQIDHEETDIIAVAGLAGRRIVVIEDDATVANAIALSLKSHGMIVTTYGNAEQALANAAIVDADFYISDLRLPGLNGKEFLDAVQQRSLEPIKAVLLTGDTSPERVELAHSTRWMVLFKPVDLQALLSAISVGMIAN